MTDMPVKFYVTHVDNIGPYLKITGQLNRDAVNIVHQRIQSLLPLCFEIDESWPLERQKAFLQPGTMCVYKKKNGAAPSDLEYMRGHIISTKFDNSQQQTVSLGDGPVMSKMHVEVKFIDYGNTRTINCRELLFSKQPNLINNIPALSTNCIVLGVCAEWNEKELEQVSKLILSEYINMTIKIETCNHKLIRVVWKDFDFAEFLIHQKKIGVLIDDNLQRDHLEKMIKSNPAPIYNKNLNNNNNLFQNNNNINNDNIMNYNQNKTATDMAREAIKAQRSLSARLEKYRQPQSDALQYVKPILPLQEANNDLEQRPMVVVEPNSIPCIAPTPMNVLQSKTPGIIAQNSRIGLTGVSVNINQPFNRTPQLQMNAFPPKVFTNPMDAYYTRYKPTNPPQPFYAAQTPRPLFVKKTQTMNVIPLNTGNMVASFKAHSLTIGETYDVVVSYVENGPYAFAVQLRSTEQELTKMMTRLENVTLHSLFDAPFVGMACLARFTEDNHVYRALISGVYQTSCRVHYVDYGNSETVSYRNIYTIPQDFLQARPYAYRFTLSGSKQLEPIDDSLKKAFKDFVLYGNFKLFVMPLEGPPLVQYCKLLRDKMNVIDTLREIKRSRLIYPKAESLDNNDIVEIRYIESPRNFYVQRKDNIDDFEKLMDEMFVYYNANQVVPNELVLGAPCIVKYDKEWYRAEVMRADDKAIIVRHVDFGYEQCVTKNLLSKIAEEHVKMPRQAVQCCLKGFENNELDKSYATDQFEMLAEESNLQRRLFTVRIFRIQPDGVNVVNLVAKNLNVMKKLYKLCVPFDKYLTLEKEEFNKNGKGSLSNKDSANRSKTPSIASSSEGGTLQTNTKGILNSTTLQSDDRMQQQKQQAPVRHNHKLNNGGHNAIRNDWDKQSHASSKDNREQQLQQTSSHNNKFNNGGHNANRNDWDKQSHASSKDNREQQHQQTSSHNNKFNNGGHNANRNDWDKQSHASSKDSREQQHHQTASGQRQQKHNELSSPSKMLSRNTQLDSSSDIQNDSSTGMSRNSGNKYNKKSNVEVPPRFQNGKQEALNNTRFNKNQSPRKKEQSQQQQHKQRPQNAPEGFAQKPIRQKSTLNTSALSKKSDDCAVPVAKDKVQPEVYAPLDQAFIVEHLKLPMNEEVTISWWVSPYQFYVQRKSLASKYDKMVREIQTFYKLKPHQQLQLKVGSNVMARLRRENLVLRAKVIACNHMVRKYKLFFVDTGNQCTVTSEDVWQVEQRFAILPCMAYRCAFEGIVSNFDQFYIVDHIAKYIPINATIKCEFKKLQKTVHYVDVMINGASLQESLTNDGFITKVPAETRIELLAGQQIRAKITSITDMLNFKIQLEIFDEKVQFFAAYDDVRFVKSNSDIAKKFKKFYEGKWCLLNIKEVNENNVILLRPMMKLLKDDIPSFICTHPIIFNRFPARIIFMQTLNRVFVQPLSVVAELEALLNDMHTFYENGGNQFDRFESDQICAAKSEDGDWYRARITTSVEKSDDAKVNVKYIDYGNTETLHNSNVKILEPQFFLNKSSYGIEINLPLGREIMKKPDAIAKLNEIIKEEVTVEPIEVRHNHLVADIKLGDKKSLVDVLISLKLAKTRDVEYTLKKLNKESPNMFEYIVATVDLTTEDDDEVNKVVKKCVGSSPKRKKQEKSENQQEIKTDNQSDKKTEEITAPAPACDVSVPRVEEVPPTPAVKSVSPIVEESLPAAPKQDTTKEKIIEKAPTPIDPCADMELAILSHCDNPAQFYLHEQDRIDELVTFQENLQIISPSLPQLTNAVNGSLCVSLYSVDKQWYRAKILDAELMVLQFIDFGNTDCVTDTTDVKESMWQQKEPYCFPCALPICPNTTADWVDAANAIFNDSYNKNLRYEYIVRGDYNKRSYIDLYIDGENVAEKLIADGYAKPLEVVKSGEYCFISHLNYISDFYIQFEKDSKSLEMIEIYLSQAKETLEPLKVFEKNQIVAALFKDDELWYRAELLREVPGEGYEVRFIDYGNTSISPECRLLDEKMANLPALSKKCELELPADRLAWSQEAEDKFETIAATGETTFTVILRQPAPNRVIVHLLIDEHNIIDDLAALCAPKETPPKDDISVNSQDTSMQNSSHHENGTQLDAIVSQVNSALDFYVQFDKDTERVKHISETLNTITLDAIDETVTVGMLCAAHFEEDDALYRARILKILSKDQPEWLVVFIDFGNESSTKKIFKLPPDLQEMKPFAKHCRLEPSQKFSQIPEVSTETFNVLLESCSFNVKVEYIDVDTEPALVKLFTSDKAINICKQLHQLLDNAKTTAADVSDDKNNSISQCVISHANSPDSFYIQIKNHFAELDLITKTLDKSNAAKLIPMHDLMEDIVVVCYSEEDDCYYRARIEQVLDDNESANVFLVDNGNLITTKKMYQLPESICMVPALAVHCTLNEIPKEVEQTKLDEAFNTLVESHFGEIYDIIACESDASSKQIVQLSIDYKDVAEELSKAVAGIETSLQPILYNCAIVHYNSQKSFYLQLENDIPELEYITDKLLDAEEIFDVYENPKVGDICAAQFSDDGAYYRAEILQLLDEGNYEVHFIDFGNNSITVKLRILPDDLRNLQRFAKHCQLDSASIAKCDAVKLQHFIDSKFSETFQAELLTTNEPFVARLFYQGKNLTDESSNPSSSA